MVSVVCERGFAGASVASVCARANVSRGSFYELFESREACFLAVIDDAHRQSSGVIAGAFERAQDWRDGVRRALAELLLLFDRESGLARVWLVETLGAGSWALERRSRHVTALTRQVVESWPQPLGAGSHPLASVSVMASVLGIVQTHALAEDPEPMITLLGPLMGVVVSPYHDERAVDEEIARGSALARKMLGARDPGRPRPSAAAPGVLRDPRAHRARACGISPPSRGRATARSPTRSASEAMRRSPRCWHASLPPGCCTSHRAGPVTPTPGLSHPQVCRRSTRIRVTHRERRSTSL
jgi:AcrR family transcriptional regulator